LLQDNISMLPEQRRWPDWYGRRSRHTKRRARVGQGSSHGMFNVDKRTALAKMWVLQSG